MTVLDTLYDRLYTAFGPQHWWPGETPFEIMVGAVLVQNTAWRNVERALENLRQEGFLSPQGIHSLLPEELEQLIRPAGYYRLKAARLRNLVRFIVEEYQGSLEEMFAVGLEDLREQLLRINGIGPETADSILLYAGGLPTFVVDTYTHRVLARHGWIDFEVDYHTLQSHFHDSIEQDVARYNEFHALLVKVGNTYCRKTPNCTECPLASLLPEGGPRVPEY